MAFALTGFRAYGIRTSGAVREHAHQVAHLIMTAAVTDVALDFSDYSGTMWTAFKADATYGSLATAAQAVLTSIQSQVYGFYNLGSPQLQNGRLQAAATSGTSYTKTVTSFLPIITCAASNGEAAWEFLFFWSLNDGIEPVVADLGAALT